MDDKKERDLNVRSVLLKFMYFEGQRRQKLNACRINAFLVLVNPNQYKDPAVQKQLEADMKELKLEGFDFTQTDFLSNEMYEPDTMGRDRYRVRLMEMELEAPHEMVKFYVSMLANEATEIYEELCEKWGMTHEMVLGLLMERMYDTFLEWRPIYEAYFLTRVHSKN